MILPVTDHGWWCHGGTGACRELSHLLAVNVCAYDYTGYGASSGLPSTANTRADITAVLGALQEHHGVAPRDVVLYGQSVGSGPTVGGGGTPAAGQGGARRAVGPGGCGW
jgi:pimeloyl-ACP methyl ester carboxylesterase